MVTDSERPEAGTEPAAEPGEDAAAVDEDDTPEYRAGAAGARPRLYCSDEYRILGGVAVGIAECFDTDPAIVRLLWVLATAMGGAGALGYLVLWIVIPPYSWLYNDAPDRKRAGAHRPGALLVLPRASRELDAGNFWELNQSHGQL